MYNTDINKLNFRKDQMIRLVLQICIWISLRLAHVFLTLPIWLYSSLRTRQKCPSIESDILLMPATLLAEQIRRKKLTSEVVIETYIARIKKVNPLINAVVEDRFRLAIEEARHVDEVVANGKMSAEELASRYPLLGVPISVKESIAVAGMSHKAGMSNSVRGKATEDADVIKLCKDAGAIPIVVSNTPELCLNWETNNKVTGRTLNPYDSRRTCGGSSGGEASLLGSGASILGLGSDVGGSLRLPAAFCGVWGHKPTPRAVSVRGHFPDSTDVENWTYIFTLGPMSRYAVDLPLLLHVMTKEDKRDALDLRSKVNLSDVKVFYMEGSGYFLNSVVDEEIVAAIRRIASCFLTKHNSAVQQVNLSELKDSIEISLATLLLTDGVDDIFNKDSKRSVLLELIRFFLCSSDHMFHSITYIMMYRILPRGDIEKMRQKLLRVKRKIEDMLGDNGVLIYPTFPSAACYHNQMIAKMYDTTYDTIFNSLGLPVTNCPVGLNRNGLPVGVQVIAKSNCDRLTLAVAQEIEKIFGGWVPPDDHERN